MRIESNDTDCAPTGALVLNTRDAIVHALASETAALKRAALSPYVEGFRDADDDSPGVSTYEYLTSYQLTCRIGV